jgi:hypothetical protein
MAPHLERWDKDWRDRGLRVVEVELGPATPLDALTAHHREKGTTFPVVHDGDGVLAKRFEVKGYPTAFLVGRTGRVVWHGHPTRDLAGFEAAIKKALGV